MSLKRWLLPPLDRDEYREGIRTMTPAGIAIASWGLVTGVAMVKSGLSVPQALLITFTVFAGSAQLAVLPLLAVGAPLPVVWATALVVNLRFLIFSAASRAYFAPLPRRQRLLAAYLNGDIGFAMFMQRHGSDPDKGTPQQWGYFFGGATVNWIGWQVASVAGIVLGGVVPSAWGLGLAAVLALLAVLIPMAANFPALVGVLVASVLALVTKDLPLKLGLLVAVIGGVFAAVLIEPLAPGGRLIKSASDPRESA
jgi:predicted branched-subunit amino acid permease